MLKRTPIFFVFSLHPLGSSLYSAVLEAMLLCEGERRGRPLILLTTQFLVLALVDLACVQVVQPLAPLSALGMQVAHKDLVITPVLQLEVFHSFFEVVKGSDLGESVQ